MLDVKDLRIGNYIIYDDRIGIVKWFTNKSFSLKMQFSTLNHTSRKGWVQLPFEPIELTDEWLLRFGLTKHNGYPYKFLDGFIKIRNGEYFFKYHNLDIKLNYVHNLQNLHYILTQTELTLKDEK
jgi:hypothetical protein